MSTRALQLSRALTETGRQSRPELRSEHPSPAAHGPMMALEETMRPRTAFAVALVLSLLVCAILATKWRQAEHRANETARWTHFVMDSLGKTVNLPRPPVEPW